MQWQIVDLVPNDLESSIWNFTEAHYVLLFCLPAVLIDDSKEVGQEKLFIV